MHGVRFGRTSGAGISPSPLPSIYWNQQVGEKLHSGIIIAIVPVSQHKIADHKKELEEFGELSAKTIGAFSLFKRGVIGSYHHLSEDHLDSYLQEFCWRYNRRKLQPFMFNTLLSELTRKKPLTYKTLTRETF